MVGIGNQGGRVLFQYQIFSQLVLLLELDSQDGLRHEGTSSHRAIQFRMMRLYRDRNDL
jgi:hypothetical protein